MIYDVKVGFLGVRCVTVDIMNRGDGIESYLSGPTSTKGPLEGVS